MWFSLAKQPRLEQFLDPNHVIELLSRERQGIRMRTAIYFAHGIERAAIRPLLVLKRFDEHGLPGSS
jgi:hypothetical protein